MSMSQSYGLLDDEESFATIHQAIENGITVFNAAEIYGPYTNEKLIGKAIKGLRDKVTIATRFGFDLIHENAERY